MELWTEDEIKELDLLVLAWMDPQTESWENQGNFRMICIVYAICLSS